MQRATTWGRLRAWLRLAYTDLSSKEHQALLEGIIWLVIVSVVMTVLQHDPALDAEYQPYFLAVEAVVFVLFALDYALNLAYAASKRGYALSFAGIVDLAAILPSLVLFVDTSPIKFLRALRFLRFLRILQVVKAVRHRQLVQGDDDNRSLLLDLQLGVIAVSALLLLVPEDRLRNELLIFTLGASLTVGLRRWLVYRQQPTLSVVVLVLSVVGVMLYALALDGAGEVDRAVWMLVGSVVIAAVTWVQIESPAGGL
jgi:hypothetical protein